MPTELVCPDEWQSRDQSKDEQERGGFCNRCCWLGVFCCCCFVLFSGGEGGGVMRDEGPFFFDVYCRYLLLDFLNHNHSKRCSHQSMMKQFSFSHKILLRPFLIHRMQIIVFPINFAHNTVQRLARQCIQVDT